jgi:hypothetical protein
MRASLESLAWSREMKMAHILQEAMNKKLSVEIKYNLVR